MLDGETDKKGPMFVADLSIYTLKFEASEQIWRNAQYADTRRKFCLANIGTQGERVRGRLADRQMCSD